MSNNKAPLTIRNAAGLRVLVSKFAESKAATGPELSDYVRSVLEEFIDFVYAPPPAFKLPLVMRRRKDSPVDGVGYFLVDANGDNIAVGLSKDVAKTMRDMMNAHQRVLDEESLV